jgi:drug/metabolite transporter (DMT)-like permease
VLTPDAYIAAGCAVTYAAAMLLIKRSYQHGVRPYQHLLFGTVVQGAVFALLLPFAEFPDHAGALVLPAIAVASFLTGQFFTVMAIFRGDASLQTPLMGTKVVFVTVLSVAVLGSALSVELWVASILATVAVFLLGWSRPQRKGHLLQGLAFGLLSALFYALTDIILVRGARDLDPFFILPFIMIGAALVMAISIPFTARWTFRFEPRALAWLLPGSLLFSLQAVGFGLSLAVWRNPSLANIVFSTRGVWSVVLVLLFGRAIAVPEHDMGRGVATARITGAALMIGVVGLLLF